MNEELLKSEELKKDYYNVINKIENKIDILDIAISGCIYIDEDEVISFNLGNFFIAVKKEDIRKLM